MASGRAVPLQLFVKLAVAKSPRRSKIVTRRLFIPFSRHKWQHDTRAIVLAAYIHVYTYVRTYARV